MLDISVEKIGPELSSLEKLNNDEENMSDQICI